MAMNDLLRLPNICFQKMLWQLQGTAQPYQIDDYIDGSLACYAGNLFSSKRLLVLCFVLRLRREVLDPILHLVRIYIFTCIYYV